MPSKGKRVASRQSNLRRRRGNANRSTPPRTNGASAVAVDDAPATDAVPGAPATTAAAELTTAAAPRAQPIRQPQGRRLQRPAAYNHVGSELRRIGIFSGILLVALIAVSFVL